MNLRCFYSRKENIAITGATGYIGQEVLKVAPTGSYAQIDPALLPDGCSVIHLAADLSNTPSSVMENYNLDRYIFDICASKKIGIVHCSGNNVYPLAQGCGLETEFSARDNYALSKICGEILLRDIYSISHITVRVGDVFGPGQRHGNFFRAIETALAAKKSLSLYGRGLKTRNYISAEELSTFLIYAAGLLTGAAEVRETLNFAYPQSAAVKDIVEHVHLKTGLPVNLIHVENDISHLDVRTMKVGNCLGYRFKYSSFWDSLNAYTTHCFS